MFVYDIRDILALGLVGLFSALWLGLWAISFVSVMWCKVRGHRFRSEHPEPFAACLRCGRRVG